MATPMAVSPPIEYQLGGNNPKFTFSLVPRYVTILGVFGQRGARVEGKGCPNAPPSRDRTIILV